MYGAVLWLDRTNRKALIWCFDQGDIAVADGCLCGQTAFEKMDLGDMVEIEFDHSFPIRICTTLRLVEKKVCVGLQEQLARVSNTIAHSGEDSALSLTGT